MQKERYVTIGSAIDDFISGRVVDTTGLSDEKKELVRDIIELIIKNTPRISARID